MIFKTSLRDSIITGLGLTIGKVIYEMLIQDRAFGINDFLTYACIVIPIWFFIAVIRNNFKIVRKTDKYI